MNTTKKMLMSIVIMGILVILLNTCIGYSQEYTAEIRKVYVPNRNTKDSIELTKLFIQRISGGDTSEIYGGMIFEFNKDFKFHIYQNILFTTHKSYDYRGTPNFYETDTVPEENVEKGIIFSRAIIGKDTLYPAQVLWISSKDYPFVKNINVTFEDNRAIVSGSGRKFIVDLKTLTATDEKG